MKKIIKNYKYILLFALFIFSEGCAHSHAHQALASYDRKFFVISSRKNDIAMGEKYMAEQIAEYHKKKEGVDLPQDAALKKRIEKIVERLRVVSDDPDLPYEVHIFASPDIVNAFCMPGGKIGVFTGLFDKKEGLVDINSDDQIAAVLGHEIAHATLRHIARKMTSTAGINLAGMAVTTVAGDVAGKAYSVGMNLYMPSYSRKHESEADRAGFYYMSKAGFNPAEAVKLWEIAAARGGPNSKKTDFFSSHPANAERANTLKSWLPEALKIYDQAKGVKK